MKDTAIDFKSLYESALAEADKQVKDPKGKIISGLEGMKPGAVMQAVAKSLGSSSPEFLKKHLLKILVNAAKNGKVKFDALKDAIKDFDVKNVEDNSNIDWDNVELDPSGTTMKCFFDGDSKKILDKFMKEYEAEMKDVGKEIEAADKLLHNDVKKAGVQLSDNEIDANGLAVASVIDSKEAKGKKGNELTKDVKAAIEQDKVVKLIILKAEAVEKKFDNIKVNSKLDKMSDAELEKKMKEFEAEIKKRTDNDLKKANESLIREATKGPPKAVLALALKALNADKDKLKNGTPASSIVRKAIQKTDWFKSLSATRRNAANDFIAHKIMSAGMKSGNYSPKDIMQNFLSGNAEKVLGSLGAESSDVVLNAIKDEGSATEAVKKLVKTGKSAKEAQKEVMSKIKGADWYKDLDRDTKDELANKFDLEANNVRSGLNADVDAANISYKPSDNFGKVPAGFAQMPDGSKVPSFSYSSMSKKISDLDNIFDDGKVTPEELKKLNGMASKLDSYVEWAAKNKGSNDPAVQMKIAIIKRLTTKYNNLVDENASNLESSTEYFNGEQGAARLSLPKGADGKAVAVAAKSEEVLKAAGGWKKALGLDKAFTALGIARLAAKTTGIMLNKGKAVADMLGALAMKYKEDKNIIADFRILLTNGEGSKSKFEDTKFAVRFDISDFKWHATCLDNRKMKFPEDKLIKVAFDSEVGKKFKKYCLDRWTSIFAPTDEKLAIIPFILNNAEKLGMDKGKLSKEFVSTIKTISKNFSKIQNAMKQ